MSNGRLSEGVLTLTGLKFKLKLKLFKTLAKFEHNIEKMPSYFKMSLTTEQI